MTVTKLQNKKEEFSSGSQIGLWFHTPTIDFNLKVYINTHKPELTIRN